MKGTPGQRPEEELTGFTQGKVSSLSGIKQNNLAFIAGVQQFFCKGLDGKSFRLWGNVVSAATT